MACNLCTKDESAQQFVVFDKCSCLACEDKLVCRECMDKFMTTNRSRSCFFCRVPYNTIYQAGWQRIASRLMVFRDKLVEILPGPPDEVVSEVLVEDTDSDWDADEDGNLAGFVVDDDEVEYDTDFEPPPSDDDLYTSDDEDE